MLNLFFHKIYTCFLYSHRSTGAAITQALPPASLSEWNKRASVDLIILFDWNTPASIAFSEDNLLTYLTNALYKVSCKNIIYNQISIFVKVKKLGKKSIPDVERFKGT